jgi:hypothetical protein
MVFLFFSRETLEKKEDWVLCLCVCQEPTLYKYLSLLLSTFFHHDTLLLSVFLKALAGTGYVSALELSRRHYIDYS